MESKFESRQIPPSFPDTFKDFFSMINEDEDHVELISNFIEDKIIPRQTGIPTTTPITNTRTCRYHCGSSKCCNNSINNLGRSSSFRVNRSAQSDYCKYAKYCCLHRIQESDIRYSLSNCSDDEKHFKNVNNFYSGGNLVLSSNKMEHSTRCTCGEYFSPLFIDSIN